MNHINKLEVKLNEQNKIIKQYEVTQKNWKDSLNKYIKSIID